MLKYLAILVVLFLLAPTLRAQTPPLQITQKNPFYWVRFSPTGSKLLSYSVMDQDLALWDVPSARVLWKRPIGFIQKADERYVLETIAWSSNEKLITTGSANGTVQLWAAESGKFLWQTEASQNSIEAMVFSPDGSRIAISSAQNKNGFIKLLNTLDGTVVKTVEDGKWASVALAFEPDGIKLKAAKLLGGVRTIDLNAREHLDLPDDQKLSVYAGERSFSEDLTYSVRRVAKDEFVIEKTDGTLIRRVKTDGFKINSLVRSKAGSAFVRVRDDIHLYDLKSGEDKVVGDEYYYSSFDVSGDGRLLAQTGKIYHTSIRVTDLSTGKTSLLDGHPSTVTAIEYSSDNSIFAVAGNDGNAYLFDAKTKVLQKTFIGNGQRLTALTFTPDGKAIITGGEDASLAIWNVATGTCVKRSQLTNRSKDIKKVTVSPDGENLLVLIEGDAILFYLDLIPVGYLNTPEGYRSTSGGMTMTSTSVPINDAVFSKEYADMIITGHADGTIRTWDPDKLTQKKKIKVADNIRFVGSIDTERIVAVGDRGKLGRFIVIDMMTGKILGQSRRFDPSYLEKMGVDPKSRYAIASGILGDLTAFDCKALTIRKIENGYSGEDSIAFSQDGSTFIAGGENQNLKLYASKDFKLLWELFPAKFLLSERETQMGAARLQRLNELAAKRARRDAEAEVFVKKYRSKIFVTFDHYGEMSDPGNKKMVEGTEPNESAVVKAPTEANAAWFRIHNSSPLPVVIPTQSIYLTTKCSYTFPNGDKDFGLCEGAEISVWFSLEDKNGKNVPYGFDFGSSTSLLPNTSAIFPVPLELLNKDLSAVFAFTFQNIRASKNDSTLDFGPEIEIKINRSSLKR